MKPKIKIMSTKPEITDEEIRSYMNFEGLLREVKSSTIKSGLSKSVKIIFLIGGIVVTALVLFYYKYEYAGPVSRKIAPDKNLELQSTPTPKNGTNLITQDEKKADKLAPAILKKQIQSGQINPKQAENKSDSVTTTALPVYREAEPKDGFPALYEYFNTELKYPKEAVKDSIQGIVTVNFIINKEGKPKKINILNSLGITFDKEVVRLIENMPSWNPATMNDEPVPSKISIPLTFRIEKIKK